MTTVLPPGWAEVELNTVCLPVSQRGPDKANRTFRYVDLSAIDNKAKRIEQATTVASSSAPSRAKQVLKAGDVLFSTVRVYLENIALVPQELDGEIASTAFCVLRPGSTVDPKYLYYFVTSRRFVQNVNDLQRGNSPPSVQDGDVRSRVLPLAPKNEQVRIVSKIDELFSRIDEGERALEQAQKLVERYRQSVLKAAVTGELTCEWREQRNGQLESGEALLQRILKARCEAWERAEIEKLTAKGIQVANDQWKRKYKEAASPAISRATDLPGDWAWASVEQAGEVRLGRQRAPQHHAGDHMRPYLRVANVYEDRLDLSDVKEMNFTPDEFKTYSLRNGDILLNEGQSPELVGRPAMYRGEIPGCCYQKTLLRFRAHAGIRPEFALLVFRSYLHSGRFRRSSNITTSIAHLAAERFVVIEFPVPSEEEQALIVDIASSKLSEIDHLERDLAAQREASAALRQSVLRAAFTGRLLGHPLAVEPCAA